MTEADEILRIKKLNLQLGAENEVLKQSVLKLEAENDALKKRLDFARGVPAEELVAGLTGGKRTDYKDGHDVKTPHGCLLEVKMSHLNRPTRFNTLRWNWDSLLGSNETKTYDFLVLVGEKDPRYFTDYPLDLPYVCFLVPRGEVGSISSDGDCVALTTNLTRLRADKAKLLKSYLVPSPERFRQL
jgi:hypothetical protein